MNSSRSRPAAPGSGCGGTGAPAGAAGTANRRRFLALAAAVIALLAAGAVALVRWLTRGGSKPSGRIQLDATGPDGELVDLDGLRRIQTNGAGDDGGDDVLLDSSTLEVIVMGPLEDDEEASAALDVPEGRACALALSWPTSHGYSVVIVDLPESGRHSLAELAARGLHLRQEPRVRALSQVDPAAADRMRALRRATTTALSACERAVSPVDRARAGAQALELATQAQLDLDRACAILAPDGALLGVTFTEPPGAAGTARAVEPLHAAGRTTMVRLVIEDASNASEIADWQRTLGELHDEGARVMVQVCDSQALDSYDETAWEQRVAALIEAFPDADAWEIGNELAGEWAGQQAVERTLAAARALRDHPATAAAPRVVTLYYQLGQAEEAHSVFTWAADNLDDELLGVTDVLGLSVYPQWHPLGAGADRVLSRLVELAAGRPVALTELGYGAEDLDDGPWWFGSESDVSGARARVAAQLTAAALGRPQAWGAPFWWYYLQDEQDSDRGVSQDLVAGSEGG